MIASWLGALQMQLLALALLTALASVACRLAAPVVFAAVRRWPAKLRADALTAFAATPVLLGAALSLVCALPSLVAGADHCLSHGGHGHLCLVHRQGSAGGVGAWLVLGAIALWCAVAAARAARELAAARRDSAALGRLARHDRSIGAWVIDADVPFGFAAGLLDVRVFVSSSLLARAPTEVLRSLLAHERGHQRRRDALRALLVDALSLAHVPSVRARVRSELALACEQACDEEAARAVGDREAVAQSIVTAARWLVTASQERSTLVRSFGASQLHARVESLLDAPSAAPRLLRSKLFVALCIASLALVFGADALHHGVESVVAPLAR